MIIPYNEGKGTSKIRNRVWDFLEATAPTTYERFVLQTRRKIQDFRYKPITEGFIKERLSQTPFPLFDSIEIETINRCNNTCSFCPVRKGVDPRPLAKMERSLFDSIVGQLADVDYAGFVSLYSNNEPLIDSRIADLCKLTKQNLPNAKLFLSTNGILLTIDRFEELMRHLDCLHINNYNNQLTLLDPHKAIHEYCLKKRYYEQKTVIIMRKKDQMRSTRGGAAPNRTTITPFKSSCVLPFTQMVVRPDGKVSLCCNDALGRVSLGDLAQDSVVDVWNSERYWNLRKSILNGRKDLSLCRSCDVFTHPLISGSVCGLGARCSLNQAL